MTYTGSSSTADKNDTLKQGRKIIIRNTAMAVLGACANV
ncbi:hypothetical protein BSPLISOX_2850 [uncultured Gammaproteobacteria bacterium]|nr:hypothetical protein BSPWISOX_2957 [uncultured Gammaproteobacteria bacterium]VVH64448.1 hypothetical protein BSPLISOX_2850 [uncultured Gammaproteobacteria bacterium]